MPHIVIQGEIYGPKINNNKLNVNCLKLAVFNMYDLNKKSYCTYKEICDNCKIMGLDMVEVVDKGESFDFTIEQLLQMAKGKYKNSGYDREGLVFRLTDKIYVDGKRASFKIINNDYLMKE